MPVDHNWKAAAAGVVVFEPAVAVGSEAVVAAAAQLGSCLLYTSDAADE